MNEEIIKALAKQGITLMWGFDGKPQYYKNNKMLTGRAYGDAALLHNRLSTELLQKQTLKGIDKALDNPYSNILIPATNIYSAGKKVLKGFNDLATLEPEIASEWDYELNKLKPTEVSRNSAKRAWWKCRYGHSCDQPIR